MMVGNDLQWAAKNQGTELCHCQHSSKALLRDCIVLLWARERAVCKGYNVLFSYVSLDEYSTNAVTTSVSAS